MVFWFCGLLLLGAGLVVLASRLWVEWSWFGQFGWGPVLLRRLGLQLALAMAALALGLVLQRGAPNAPAAPPLLWPPAP